MIRSWFCSRPRQRLSRTTRRTDGQTMDTPLNSGDFLDYLFDNFINRCFDTVSIHWQNEVWGEQKRSATFALRTLHVVWRKKIAKNLRNIREIFAKYSQNIREKFVKILQKNRKKFAKKKFAQNS